jgi:adenylate kinase
MRVLLIAPPGAGKGTQAKRIAERYGVPHISSGEVLRGHVKRSTAIGREVQRALAQGDLVPDAVVISVLAEPVLEAAESGGYVLDGFPRTAHQAEVARDLAEPLGVEVQRAVALEVPEDELLGRLLKRSQLDGRVDDTEDVIRHRLKVFGASEGELIDYYDKRGLLDRVDGTGSPDEVSERLWKVLDPLREPGA